MSAANEIVCIGGALVDRKFHLDGSSERDAPSACGRTVVSFGGVARNVAENLARLGLRARLISLAGDDRDGRALLDDLVAHGIDASEVARVADASTAQYLAVIDPAGELAFELADTTIFERLDAARVARAQSAFAPAAWVFAETNLLADAVAVLVAGARGASYRLALDAVSVPKASRLPAELSGCEIVFLNVAEARSYLDGSPPSAESCAAAIRARGANSAVVMDGAAGVVVAAGDRVERIPAARAARVADVTGAGDALVATTLRRLCAGDDLVTAVAAGTQAAARTIETDRTVHANDAVTSTR
ncbi:MAG TPA: PfkB family carbohydrate kinase [Candidatus Elarobacter sp.]|nr:PfkB family carbohydrate kinase [Candidatus Elarobacter sp.]